MTQLTEKTKLTFKRRLYGRRKISINYAIYMEANLMFACSPRVRQRLYHTAKLGDAFILMAPEPRPA